MMSIASWDRGLILQINGPACLQDVTIIAWAFSGMMIHTWSLPDYYIGNLALLCYPSHLELSKYQKVLIQLRHKWTTLKCQCDFQDMTCRNYQHSFKVISEANSPTTKTKIEFRWISSGNIELPILKESLRFEKIGLWKFLRIMA